MQLFGTNHAQVFVKNIEEFPATYKEKMFKPQEFKPPLIANLVKTELDIVNKTTNDVTIEGAGDPSASDEKNIGKFFSALLRFKTCLTTPDLCENLESHRGHLTGFFFMNTSYM